MIIYKITNKINGKRYIGQTIGTLARRWTSHCKNKHNFSHPISRAIKKYNKENFEINVICVCDSMEEMNHREAYYIKLFNTLCPRGYNLKHGGRNSLHSATTKLKMSNSKKGCKNAMFGKKHTKATLEKISLTSLGRKHSPVSKLKMSSARKGRPTWNKGIPCKEETKIKISNANKGPNHCMYGKKHSQETINKMSMSKIGKKAPIGLIEKLIKINSKKVICHENNMIFDSAKIAAKYFKISPQSITQVVKRQRKQCKGWTFSYFVD